MCGSTRGGCPKACSLPSSHSPRLLLGALERLAVLRSPIAPLPHPHPRPHPIPVPHRHRPTHPTPPPSPLDVAPAGHFRRQLHVPSTHPNRDLCLLPLCQPHRRLPWAGSRLLWRRTLLQLFGSLSIVPCRRLLGALERRGRHLRVTSCTVERRAGVGSLGGRVCGVVVVVVACVEGGGGRQVHGRLGSWLPRSPSFCSDGHAHAAQALLLLLRCAVLRRLPADLPPTGPSLPWFCAAAVTSKSRKKCCYTTTQTISKSSGKKFTFSYIPVCRCVGLRCAVLRARNRRRRRPALCTRACPRPAPHSPASRRCHGERFAGLMCRRNRRQPLPSECLGVGAAPPCCCVVGACSRGRRERARAGGAWCVGRASPAPKQRFASV